MPLRSIYDRNKKKNKTYKGVWELYSAKTDMITGYYVNYADEFGKTIKVRATDAANRDEALEYLNQCKADVRRAKQTQSNYTTAKKHKKIRLNDLATEYFTTKGTSIDKRVKARYDNHVRLEPLGSLIVDNISLADAEALKATLETKKMSKTKKGSESEYRLSKGTVNHVLGMCKTIIKFGVKNKWCTDNIFDDMNVKRTSQKRLKVLKPTEMNKLIEDAGYSKRLQMFIRMLYYTAQRPKTILELQRKHIDLPSNKIAIGVIKNQEATTVPISKKLLPYLTEWIESLDSDDYLFHRMKHPQGTGVTDTTSKVSFQQIQKSAIKLFKPYNKGLDSKEDRLMITSFYTIRHSAATNILRATKDIYLVKEILNHSDIKMTERYAKLAEDAKQGGLDEL